MQPKRILWKVWQDSWLSTDTLKISGSCMSFPTVQKIRKKILLSGFCLLLLDQTIKATSCNPTTQDYVSSVLPIDLVWMPNIHVTLRLLKILIWNNLVLNQWILFVVICCNQQLSHARKIFEKQTAFWICFVRILLEPLFDSGTRWQRNNYIDSRSARLKLF